MGELRDWNEPDLSCVIIIRLAGSHTSSNYFRQRVLYLNCATREVFVFISNKQFQKYFKQLWLSSSCLSWICFAIPLTLIWGVLVAKKLKSLTINGKGTSSTKPFPHLWFTWYCYFSLCISNKGIKCLKQPLKNIRKFIYLLFKRCYQSKYFRSNFFIYKFFCSVFSLRRFCYVC